MSNKPLAFKFYHLISILHPVISFKLRYLRPVKKWSNSISCAFSQAILLNQSIQLDKDFRLSLINDIVLVNIVVVVTKILYTQRVILIKYVNVNIHNMYVSSIFATVVRSSEFTSMVCLVLRLEQICLVAYKHYAFYHHTLSNITKWWSVSKVLFTVQSYLNIDRFIFK